MIKTKKTPNILVVGDLMIDHYLWGSCNRISPEAPVQVVDVSSETSVLGGAGNVINNLISLGANVSILSVIGDDESGNELKSMLEKQNVNASLVVEKNRETSRKTRLMASKSQVVRYDKESKDSISPQSVQELYEKFLEKIGAVQTIDVILLSDYAKGVLTFDLVSKIITTANKKGIKVLVDPKGDDYAKYKGAYLLTPNKKEAEIASKIKIEDQKTLTKCLKKLKKEASMIISLVTLSEGGIAFLQNDRVSIKSTVAKEVYDVTGAGDTVLASLGFAIGLGNNIEASVEFANLAAGVVVGKLGSATVTMDEIQEYKSSLLKSSIELQIKTIDEIEKISKRLKSRNKKLVFTNGCFDILHKGHVSYLNIAKSFGDVLILGLNSDPSVKRLKGEDRPINTQDDRAYILSSLKCVDYVVIFDEDTPYELIKKVQPNILVKGADYELKNIVGVDIADETKLVEFVNGISTTKTIERIKKANK